MSSTILIVDDEVDLVDGLEFNLQREGFETRRAHTAGDGWKQATTATPPDLILLDLMLPDMSGTELCRELRTNPATATLPILMVTARDDEIDRIVGFEVGADDYLTKPFSVRELVLRIRALLRRSQKKRTSTAHEHVVGPLTIDPAAHRVSLNGEELKLTVLEFRLLATLVERAGRVQTRETLLRDVWGMAEDITTRTVDSHMTRLRRKLGALGAAVETRRGVGYLFRADKAEALAS
jgi:two-component system phosphate regulon response regulator PhoB